MRRAEGVWSLLGSEEFQKKAVSFFVAFLLLYSVLRAIAAAAVRPLWFDEILTFTIANQSNLHEMWAAITRGFDAQPPPFYFVERACLGLPVSREIALRLPSILSFPLLLFSVFTFAKKNAGHVAAGCCVVALLSTSLFHLYSIEARGYLLMSAFIAFALPCYQRLPSVRWSVMLGLSLFLAQSFHYYAVFAMIPFGLAEVVFSWKSRKIRWFAWAALAFGVIPLLVWLPLLTTVRTFYGSEVFSRIGNSPWVLIQYYGSYFFMTDSMAAGAMAAFVGATSWLLISMIRSNPVGTDQDYAAVAESVLIIGLALLPFILFCLLRPLHGGLLDRYTLPATIGVVLTIAAALRVLGTRAMVLFALFIVVSIGISETRFWRHQRNDALVQQNSPNIVSLEQFARIQTFIQSGGRLELPVVYAHPVTYTQVTHYAPSSLTGRLICLVSRTRELNHRHTDSMFLLTDALREFYPIRLADYDKFTTTTPEFLLYADHMDWPLQDLSSEAASVQLLRSDGEMCLYLIKMTKNSAD